MPTTRPTGRHPRMEWGGGKTPEA